MSTFTRVFAAGLAVPVLLLGSPGVVADESPDTAAAPASAAAVPARTNPFGASPLDDGALAARRGGTEVVSVMRLRGVVANNQVSNATTGNNTMSDGALAGASGLPMVIQNTGNNVLIQNATIVNVQMK